MEAGGTRGFVRVGVGVGVVAAAVVVAAGFAALSLVSGCGASTTLARPTAPVAVDPGARVVDDGFVFHLRDANGTRDAAFVDEGFLLGSIAVVEEGAHRGVFDEDGALRYNRDDGASWFTPAERGVEEWTRVDVAAGEDVVVLKWHLDGASLAIGAGDSVLLEGAEDYVVTAPVAFGDSGASYQPHLSIDNDDTIVVTVSGASREHTIDVDPIWGAAFASRR
jgi:hypothetical protein